jgi:hypothetical protein
MIIELQRMEEICRRTTVKLEAIFGEYHKGLSKGIVSIYLILASCTTIPTTVEAALEVTFDRSKSSDPEDIDYLSLDTTKR